MGLLGKKKKEASWVVVARETDFVHSLEVKVDGFSYALLRSEGQVYCTQGSCSHEYSPLAEGMVAAGEVYCEKHGSRFRLSDGEVLSPPACDRIKVYPVRIEDGVISILV